MAQEVVQIEVLHMEICITDVSLVSHSSNASLSLSLAEYLHSVSGASFLADVAAVVKVCNSLLSDLGR